jgi:hypothetical protein
MEIDKNIASHLESRRREDFIARHVQRRRLGGEGWLRYSKSIAASSKEAKNERSSKHGDFKNCVDERSDGVRRWVAMRTLCGRQFANSIRSQAVIVGTLMSLFSK